MPLIMPTCVPNMHLFEIILLFLFYLVQSLLFLEALILFKKKILTCFYLLYKYITKKIHTCLISRSYTDFI